MSKELDQILAWCLEAIEEGYSIESCLNHFPKERYELEPLLHLAASLRQAPPVTPSLAFRLRMTQRLKSTLAPRQTLSLGDYFHRLINPKGSRQAPSLSLQKRRFSMKWLVVLTTVASLVTGGGAAYASGEALPGDVLYPVKMGLEDFQLAISLDNANDAMLQLEFAQERVAEMQFLASEGRLQDIPIATQGYQNQVNQATQTLREMVLNNDSQTQHVGTLVQETLFYDSMMLSGIQESLPEEMQAHVEVAIGASKSGNSIAGQWLKLANQSNVQNLITLATGIPLPIGTPVPGGEPIPLPTTFPSPAGGGDIPIPLPTGIACWPAELPIDPPDGVPICEPGEYPITIPEGLVCWPSNIPLEPPEGIPLCEEGQLPIELPEDLDLICWPSEIPYDPPEGIPVCEEGQLPIPLPEDLELECWPAEIPFDPPAGIPICEEGQSPIPLPTGLPNQPGDGEFPFPGEGEFPFPGDDEFPFPGDGEFPFPGDGEFPFPGDGEFPFSGNGGFPFPAGGEFPFSAGSGFPFPGGDGFSFPGSDN